MSKLQQTLLPIKLEESKERLTNLAGLVLVEEWGRAKGMRAVQQTSKELIRSFLKSLGEEITIDPDATIIEADKREAEWTYQKVKGYQPRYIGAGLTK